MIMQEWTWIQDHCKQVQNKDDKTVQQRRCPFSDTTKVNAVRDTGIASAEAVHFEETA